MAKTVAITPSTFAEQDTAPLDLLTAAGINVIKNPYGRRLTENEALELLRSGVDGLIAGLEPLTRDVLHAAKDLKAVARVGIGLDNVDLQAAKEFGIKVSNTPDGPTEAVAEMTLTALLALSRELIPTNDALHQGKWHKTIGKGIGGTNVLIIGYGRIGKRVAEILHFMGARILIFDPFLPSEFQPIVGRKVELSEGLKIAEVISLHAGGDQEIIGPDEFALMRNGVMLLNSARGELVNEGELIAALDEGKIASAWFDAFWQEPYTGQLCQYEQVLMTPHTSTYTAQCRKSMEIQAVQNLLTDLDLEVDV